MADIEVEERQRALDEATAIAKACVDGKLTETQRIALAASIDAKLGVFEKLKRVRVAGPGEYVQVSSSLVHASRFDRPV